MAGLTHDDLYLHAARWSEQREEIFCVDRFIEWMLTDEGAQEVTFYMSQERHPPEPHCTCGLTGTHAGYCALASAACTAEQYGDLLDRLEKS